MFFGFKTYFIGNFIFSSTPKLCHDELFCYRPQPHGVASPFFVFHHTRKMSLKIFRINLIIINSMDHYDSLIMIHYMTKSAFIKSCVKSNPVSDRKANSSDSGGLRAEWKTLFRDHRMEWRKQDRVLVAFQVVVHEDRLAHSSVSAVCPESRDEKPWSILAFKLYAHIFQTSNRKSSAFCLEIFASNRFIGFWRRHVYGAIVTRVP